MGHELGHRLVTALLLEHDPAARDAARPEVRARDPWDEAHGPRLICARCGHPISAGGWALEVAGAHGHSFVNPHGYLYRVGCFRHAPGCAPQGEAQSEYSWFPGYSWQIAVCGGCGAHLGWAFAGREPAFHGLILDRLTPQGPAGEGRS